LKPTGEKVLGAFGLSFEPTYKELKPGENKEKVERKCKVLSLPIRN